VHKHLPRAHSVTILNEASSGKPLCTINTTLVSGIRTAGVSGLLLKEYLKIKPASQTFNVGITGFGPIGQMHLSMVAALLGDRLNKVSLFDLRPVNVAGNRLLANLGDQIEWVDSWESAYEDADIFITCTVSDHRYVDKTPKKGSLQLNVSLRDYTADFLDHVAMVVVDDWEEVCRENTDIDLMHQVKGLQKEGTRSIVDVVENQVFRDLEPQDVIMFNPMGMAVFDIAIGGYYYRKASHEKVGTVLMD
jgi:N-[(2S)-2-amino-2-carboxyethyl]-L-glutamate dehydrogenase